MSEFLENLEKATLNAQPTYCPLPDPPIGQLLVKYPYILRESIDGNPLYGEELTVHLKKLLLRWGLTPRDVFKTGAFKINPASKVIPELTREQVILQFVILRLEGWSWSQIDTAYNQDFLTDEELEALKDDELRLKNGIAIHAFQTTVKKECRGVCIHVERFVRPIYDILEPCFDQTTTTRLTALRKKFKVPHNLALFNIEHLPSNDPTTIRYIPIMVEILYKHYCLGQPYSSIVSDLMNKDRNECARDILTKSRDPENLIAVFVGKTMSPTLRSHIDELQRIERYRAVAQLFVQGKSRKDAHEFVAQNYRVTNEYDTLNHFFYNAGTRALNNLPKETQEMFFCSITRNARGWWSPSVAAYIHVYGDVSVPEAIRIAKKLNVRTMPEDFRRYKVTRKRVDK